MSVAALPAVSTVVFDGHPWEAGLDLMAGLGVGWVEPAFIKGYVAFDEGDLETAGAARLRRLLEARGLRARAVSAHMDLSGEDAEAMLARRMGLAVGLGAEILVTNAGPARAGDAIRRRLDAALPRLEAVGVTLALENPGHGSGDLIGRGEDGAALVASFGHERLRLNVDVGNLVTYGGAMEPGLSAALPFAVQAHLKDVAEDGPDWRFVALGEGVVDWAAVARLAPGLPVAVELPLRLRRPRRGDPVRDREPVPLAQVEAALRQSLEAWARVG